MMLATDKKWEKNNSSDLFIVKTDYFRENMYKPFFRKIIKFSHYSFVINNQIYFLGTFVAYLKWEFIKIVQVFCFERSGRCTGTSDLHIIY